MRPIGKGTFSTLTKASQRSAGMAIDAITARRIGAAVIRCIANR